MPGKNVRAAVLALLVVPLIVTGCSKPPAEPEASPTPSVTASPSVEASPSPSATVEPVATLDGIKVTGKFGEDPEIDFKTPMAIDKTRSSVLVKGNGPVVGEGATVEVNYRGVLGRTGKEFDSSFGQNAPAVFPIDRTVAGFKTGLVGKRVGDRVLIAIPGPDAYDEAVKAGAGPVGMEVGDTLVFVIDILATSLDSAIGEPVKPEFQQVSVSEGNLPEAKIPSASQPPSNLVIQPIIKGEGRTVKAKDSIIVHYRTWVWRTGKLVEDRFDAQQSGRLADTIDAWKKGLEGQTVGSRVMLVAPSADTYPSGNSKISMETGDTLVYVIDILFASPHLT